MRALVVALLLGLCGLIGPSQAQQYPTKVWSIQGPMTALGYCQLSGISAATSLSSCTNGIPSTATFAVIVVETNAVRWRDDGTAPTAF